MSRPRQAGSGADEVARRARRKEERLSGCSPEEALVGLRQWRESWEAGAEGERAVGAALDGLADHGWRVLHDVHWPGRQQANLDHVVVGPCGVVVVDAKNWSGRVTLTDGVLRQNGYRRTAVLESSLAAAAAVTAVVDPRFRRLVRVSVCLVQQQLEAWTSGDGVVLVGLEHLVAWLTALPAELTPEEVEVAHRQLARRLSGPRSPVLTTTAEIGRVSTPPVHEPPARARRRRPTSPTRTPARGTRRPPVLGAAAGAPVRPRRRPRRPRRLAQGIAGVLAAVVALGVAGALAERRGDAPGTAPAPAAVVPAVPVPAVPVPAAPVPDGAQP